MRVDSIELFHVRIPFKGSFKHALKERREADAVLIAVHGASGQTGWGEIVPRDYLTGETLAEVFAEDAPARAKSLLGTNFESFEALKTGLEKQLETAGRRLATLGGFELALIDLFGKEFQIPAHRFLGAAELGPELPAGVVIGFEVDTAALPKHCAMLRMAGKKHLKVKVGLDDDLERLALIQRAFGPTHPIRLDANAAWTVPEAIDRLLAMKRFAIASIEQPIAARDYAGLREIREKTGTPVMADESLCSEEDARRLILEKAADVFNVRVGKCGGLIGSQRIVELARAQGLGCHLGALVGETGILSAAAEIFGRAVPVFDCLEGKGQHKFLLADDVTEPSGNANGLGLNVDRAKVEKYLVTREGISGGST
jgi:L-Ala-D/L-Glu epimerase